MWSQNNGEVADSFMFMLPRFLVLIVKMVKIGIQVIAELKPGFRFFGTLCIHGAMWRL